MPNYPLEAREQDKRRPRRYERLRDLAAFLLGYEPYHLFADLFYFRDSLAPETERSLRDLPVHLGSFLDPYSISRLGATIDEVIAQYEAHPTTQAPKNPKQRSTTKKAVDAVTSVNRPVTDRDDFSFNSFFYGGDQPGHALIRLAQSASERLTDPMQQWFRFGQAVGQCLLRAAAQRGEPYESLGADGAEERQDNTEDVNGNPPSENENAEIDLSAEIQEAASGTDWHPDDVPVLTLDEFRRSKSPQRYRWWVYSAIEKLVVNVARFLEDDAPIKLSRARLALWFLGAPVHLTRKECDLLVAAVECRNGSISRECLLRIEPEVPGQDESDIGIHKADIWLQQIINKIVESLAKAKSLYYRGTDQATRNWLRDEFFVTVQTVGWRKGPLLARMVIDG